jgi:hypothetical protein
MTRRLHAHSRPQLYRNPGVLPPACNHALLNSTVARPGDAPLEEEADAVRRHDVALDARSSRSQGMCRLSIIEIVQLHPDDEVTVVVSFTCASDPTDGGKATHCLLAAFE